MANSKLALEIGTRIAQRRKQLGFTQEQAAERADLTQQFFASVEIGAKNIRAESVIKVCRALNISADYLLTGTVSEIDCERIVQLMKTLDAAQFVQIESIITEIIAFGTYKKE